MRRMMNISKRTHREQGFTIVELMIATVVFSVVLLGITTILLQISQMYTKGVINARTQEVARTVVDQIAESIQFTNVNVVLPTGNPNPAQAPIAISGGDKQEGAVGYFCVGALRYSFAIDRMMSRDANVLDRNNNLRSLRHVFWVDRPIADPNGENISGDGCLADNMEPANLDLEDPCSVGVGNGDFACEDGRSLFQENMRILRFSLDRVANSDALWKIDLKMLHGDDDLFADLNKKRNNGTFETDINDITCAPAGVGAEFCAVASLSTVVQRRPIGVLQ